MAIARDEVECPRRKTHRGSEFGHAQQRQACVFGRFDHAGVARCQCATHAAAKNLQGVIPGHDVASHAMGFAHRHHGVAVLVRDGVAQQLVGSTGIKLKIANHGRCIGAGLAEGLAAVTGFKLGQFFGMVLQSVSQFHQQSPTLGGRQSTPSALIGTTGGLHGLIYIVCIASCQAGEGLATGGVDDGHGLARLSRQPLVVNEMMCHVAQAAVLVMCLNQAKPAEVPPGCPPKRGLYSQPTHPCQPQAVATSSMSWNR